MLEGFLGELDGLGVTCYKGGHVDHQCLPHCRPCPGRTYVLVASWLLITPFPLLKYWAHALRHVQAESSSHCRAAICRQGHGIVRPPKPLVTYTLRRLTLTRGAPYSCDRMHAGWAGLQRLV